MMETQTEIDIKVTREDSEQRTIPWRTLGSLSGT